MNRKIKKLSAVFLILAMLVLALPGQLLISYAASGKIMFSDPTASVGNQVSVTMKITSSDGPGLGNSDVMLEYDASALEFLSGTSANGGAGSVRVVGSMESANQTTFSFTLKFKALKAGTTSITVKSQEVYDSDSRLMTMAHVGSSAVKVNAPENASKDASLASLTISPGRLTPSFSADVTEYSATVSENVEKVTVSAPAKDGKASVVVEGSDELVIGDNEVVCKVTAEDGTTTKTYTIRVTKVEGEAPDNGQEPENAGDGNKAVNVEEGNWSAAETFDAALLPEGFTVTDFIYNGTSIQVGVNEQGITLIYMKDENGTGDFFVYDAEAGILAPYITVRMAEKTILVLPPEEIPEGTELPEGFKSCTIDIGEHTVDGWIYSNDGNDTLEYCILYGQNASGEKNFYRYDQKEMTLQRYFQDPDAAELRKMNTEIVEKYNSLVDDYNVRGWIIAGLFGVCILLLIILIVLLLTRKPKKSSDFGIDRYQEEPEEEIRPVRTRKNVSAGRTPREAKSVADMEKELAGSLAREAGQAAALSKPMAIPEPVPAPQKAPATAPGAVQTPAEPQSAETKDELDDDFEMIDLDL